MQAVVFLKIRLLRELNAHEFEFVAVLADQAAVAFEYAHISNDVDRCFEALVKFSDVHSVLAFHCARRRSQRYL
jgi:hypothetical protein